MKILITGISGLIGSWVAEQLKREGHQIVGLDKCALPPAAAGEQISCDILDRSALVAAVMRAAPDALIHLAARTDLNETEDLGGYASNIDGVRNVISAVRQTPSIRRAVYTSSQLVCRVGHVPASDAEYCPDTLYGHSKVWTERIVREEDGGGVEWCLARPTTVWGPRMSPHYQSMLRLIKKGLYFHCGKGALYKSYAYAGNIAYQYARLLSAPAESIHRKTFYLADYQPLSLRKYTSGLAREMRGSEIPTIPVWSARLLALAGDVLHACGVKNVPFNSFRLKNILTEYMFDLKNTAAVCGALPFTQDEGIKATAEWFLAEVEQ